MMTDFKKLHDKVLSRFDDSPAPDADINQQGAAALIVQMRKIALETTLAVLDEYERAQAVPPRRQ